MVDTFTPNYGMTLPEVSASDNTWGDKYNQNLDTIDAQMKANADAIQAARGYPAGAIIFWSGSVAAIPAGWSLCDGNSGTPDLRDRFIVGAQGAHSVGDSGGSGTSSTDGAHNHSLNLAGGHTHGGKTAGHAVTLAQIPPHNHGGGGHTHSAFKRTLRGISGGSNPFAYVSVDYGFGTDATEPSGALFSTDGGGAEHDHTIGAHGSHAHTVNSAGAHSHTATPPYYALVMIQKQ